MNLLRLVRRSARWADRPPAPDAARPAAPSQGARPVMLNTWEAVYFDHRLDRLGEWTVDPTVWPDGLHPLVARVRSLSMQVGLWVEPEMVNPDSDLARAHPDWLLAAPVPAVLFRRRADRLRQPGARRPRVGPGRGPGTAGQLSRPSPDRRDGSARAARVTRWTRTEPSGGRHGPHGRAAWGSAEGLELGQRQRPVRADQLDAQVAGVTVDVQAQ
ncbi:alpha-galactosidase [Streptomyces rimosus]|uniref:alpha-galactosidase n=1 Tax=Streptomyces rimosus TaxID=1927 RepID=UPI002D21B33D|nr:alpha-galactosidase [Streptomyces rimosus]